MIRKLIVLAASLLITGQAFAADKKVAWTGCHIGAHVGYSSTNTDAGLNVDAGWLGAASVGADGLAASGVAFGGGVGCDYRITGSNFVLGAFGDFTRNDLDHGLSANIDLFGIKAKANAKYSIEDAWTVGGRLGYLVTESVMVYGLAGYTKADTSPLSVSIAGDINGKASFKTSDLDGWVVGGGVELNIADGWFVKGEYRYTRYDGDNVTILPGVADLNLDTEEHAARVGVLYRFGM